ncbi:MAG: hypothetical protein NVS9B6_19500 [Candidatus Limnocylindrales bacterium]
MVGRKKKVVVPVEEPVDLSSRIGGREPAVPPAPGLSAFGLPPVRRHDGPIDSAARARPGASAGATPRDRRHTTLGAAPQAVPSGRPTMIGLDEAPMTATAPPSGRPPMIGLDEPPAASTPVPAPAAKPERPAMIGLEESLAPPPPRIAILEDEPAAEPPLLSVREAPEFGEIDLVATPLPTPDDWHHFELALRKLRGIGELRTEYYRAGVLKVRVRWSGADRFANAVRSVPGYRVRVLGEDRNTVQVLIGRR